MHFVIIMPHVQPREIIQRQLLGPDLVRQTAFCQRLAPVILCISARRGKRIQQQLAPLRKTGLYQLHDGAYISIDRRRRTTYDIDDRAFYFRPWSKAIGGNVEQQAAIAIIIRQDR